MNVYVCNEVDGIKVYIKDYEKEKEIIEDNRIFKVDIKYILDNKEIDAKELTHKRLSEVTEIVKNNIDTLKKHKIKYVILMSLSELIEYKPLLYKMITFNELLAFYKRKPKFLP